jgi:IS30 family transposase
MIYTHLSQKERYHIENLKSEGLSQNRIAKILGRSASTLSRELRRNEGKRGWRPCQAHEKARDRLVERGHANVRKISEPAWEYAKTQLIEHQWSPEQIAGRLKLEKKDGISHESIYQRIGQDKKAGGTLHTHLRCQKKRRRRYGTKGRGKPKIPNRVGIEERSKLVAERLRIGDWEGDTIIGGKCKGALVSSVERVSRFTVLGKVSTKDPIKVAETFIDKLSPFKEFASTMTLDNGGEFCLHEKFAKELDMKVYFATPYCSWERGTNENTNGLIRQYFKKKMNFDAITDDDIRRVEYKLNNRPRKCLGYKTPYEVFIKVGEKEGIALRV